MEFERMPTPTKDVLWIEIAAILNRKTSLLLLPVLNLLPVFLIETRFA